MRVYLPIAFLIFFVGWILYRLFIKRDLKEHLDYLYFGLFFIGIWILIYLLILT
jgi:hypothetical protein